MKRVYDLLVVLALLTFPFYAISATGAAVGSNVSSPLTTRTNVIQIAKGVFVELETYGIEVEMESGQKWYVANLAIYDTKGIELSSIWAHNLTDLGFDSESLGNGSENRTIAHTRVGDPIRRDAHVITVKQKGYSQPSKLRGGLGPKKVRFEFDLPSL